MKSFRPNTRFPHPAGNTLIASLQSKGGSSGTHDLCPLIGFRPREQRQIEPLIGSPREVKAGTHVYCRGTPHQSMFLLWKGFLKSSIVGLNGAEHVIGFHVVGDMFGWDGVDSGIHTSDLVALEDSFVSEVDYCKLENLARRLPSLQRHLFRHMSREISLHRDMMLLLGTMGATARVASFLLSMAKRYGARGNSTLRFDLNMSRKDMGSFLGLTFESVSRVFAIFKQKKVIDFDGRAIEIESVDRLRKMIEVNRPMSRYSKGGDRPLSMVADVEGSRP